MSMSNEEVQEYCWIYDGTLLKSQEEGTEQLQQCLRSAEGEVSQFLCWKCDAEQPVLEKC